MKTEDSAQAEKNALLCRLVREQLQRACIETNHIENVLSALLILGYLGAEPLSRALMDLCPGVNPRASEPKEMDFEALYAKYPRKEGKSKGLIRCRSQITTPADFDQLSGAIDRYSSHCQRTGQIIQFFSSFLGTPSTGYPWRDWTQPETGQNVKIETTYEEHEARILAERKAQRAAQDL